MQKLVYFEAAAIVLVFGLALFRPQLGDSWFEAVSRRCDGIANRKVHAVIVVGLVALGVSTILSFIQWPQPRIHDEFSYLLAADTFTHGRLTNPTPPLQEHFESKHILVTPTYQSKYPPGQGLILAVGQLLTGEPIVGAWVAMALACAALCWMLQAWVPERWAMLGGLLAALHLGAMNDWHRGRFFYWSQSYWGGAVAMMGGALVFGALWRTLREPRLRDSVVLGLGLAVLANTRPYEGLLASLPVAVVLVGWPFTRNGPALSVWTRKVALPILAVLALAALALGYYQYRVTESPFRMPYMVYEARAQTAPDTLWLWSKPDSSGEHDVGEDSGERNQARSRELPLFQWLLKEYKVRFLWNWTFLLGPTLTVPLLALPWVRKDRWVLFGVITCGMVLVANLGTVTGFPHYYAPVTALVLALVIRGLLQLNASRWRGRPTGQMLVRGLVATAFVTFVLSVGLHAYFSFFNIYPTLWSQHRADVVSRLERLPGKHLIVVRGPPPADRERNEEWVYNGADIEGAKVVWARELDPASTTRLLRHFHDRTVFFLDAETTDVKFSRYSPRVRR